MHYLVQVENIYNTLWPIQSGQKVQNFTRIGLFL